MDNNNEKEQTPEISRFKKNLLNWKDPNDRKKIYFQLISIILSILIMILSSIISYDSEVSKSIAEELIENFETGYFMDFNDTDGDEGNIVKFGLWQGTIDGCGIIKDEKKQAVRLDKGEKCEYGEMLEAIPFQYIDKYKDLTLYASTKGKYIDLLKDGSIIPKDQKCPENKKNCGYIDTLKNILCLNNKMDCPISYIKIQQTKPTKAQNIKLINGSKINFYFSNNPYPDGEEIPYIVNSFKIADSKICALPNLYYSKINLHILDGNKKQYSTDCVLNDYSQKVTIDTNRYFKLDEVDNYELYEENGIIDKNKNAKLVDYGFNIDNYKTNKLNLYLRTHFGFDINCLNDMNFSEDILIYIYSRADKMLVYGNWAYFSIVIIFFSITNFFSFSGFFHSKLYSLETLIKYFVNFSSSFGLLIYSFNAKDYEDNYEQEMKCSDITTNNNYNIMIYKVKRSGKIIEWTFFIYILLFINILISVIYVYRQKMIKKKNKSSNSSENLENIKSSNNSTNNNINEKKLKNESFINTNSINDDNDEQNKNVENEI